MTESFPERFGRYTLLQRVAFGGMAEILLAIEDSANSGRRFVTIKRIRSEFARDPDYVEFFINEGRVSMQCSHPNLTTSLELDTVEGTNFLAMEYIRGHTLLDVIRTCYQSKKHLSIGCVLRVAQQVAAGLEHLHGMSDAAGAPLHVVHRDVTPQNIMVDSSGHVTLIDFGIARSGLQVHKTEAGTVKGKLSYIAPEQLGSKRTLDQRADIFALGIVMHEALTNRGLFRGKDDQDTLKRVRTMKIPPVSFVRPDVPPEIDHLIAKALERSVDNRFQSATELLRAIDLLPPGYGPCSQSALRDEVLGHCGDPPVPTLGGESFSALQAALRSGSDSETTTEDPSIHYFLRKASVTGESEP